MVATKSLRCRHRSMPVSAAGSLPRGCSQERIICCSMLSAVTGSVAPGTVSAPSARKSSRTAFMSIAMTPSTAATVSRA